jgi:hypothetical protein
VEDGPSDSIMIHACSKRHGGHVLFMLRRHNRHHQQQMSRRNRHDQQQMRRQINMLSNWVQPPYNV